RMASPAERLAAAGVRADLEMQLAGVTRADLAAGERGVAAGDGLAHIDAAGAGHGDRQVDRAVAMGLPAHELEAVLRRDRVEDDARCHPAVPARRSDGEGVWSRLRGVDRGAVGDVAGAGADPGAVRVIDAAVAGADGLTE